MSEEIKSITGLLEELDKTPPLTSESGAFASLSVDEKAAMAFSYRMRGASTESIAKLAGVCVATVYNWLNRHAEQYRNILEQQPPANIIADSLLFLSHIEEMCLFEAFMLEGETDEIEKRDPATGEITRKSTRISDWRQNNMRKKFIDGALNARQMKLDLMLKTGVLPKEPERLYHELKDSDMSERDKRTESSRSKEELAGDLIRLLESSRRL